MGGRNTDTPQVRLIRAMSRRGILVGSVETALLPALHAATGPDARGGRLYGPDGFMNLRGAPAEHDLYRPLRSTEDAARIWRVSEGLTKVPFPASGSDRPRSVEGTVA